ncbi:hypothetical protein EYF80_013222 [Liparis tanakae]|uniref:Uncharacterized protein n=1 Tax=Liparis tanakae TaxID=230148 RepID=A0A4Z2IGW9_9TELE|nr:hypothetical protein EYF80_013222 [Liparis tanakae]
MSHNQQGPIGTGTGRSRLGALGAVQPSGGATAPTISQAGNTTPPDSDRLCMPTTTKSYSPFRQLSG